MSQLPPLPPDDMNDGTQPRGSRMALTAMILGIIAIPLVCAFGLGVLLGIVAVILGIVSLAQIARSGDRFHGRGYAIAGIVTGAISCTLLPIVAVLLAILLPSLGRAREMANRGTCAANLRGIVQSMNLYGAGEGDMFPVLPYAPYGPANSGTSAGTSGPTEQRALDSMFDAASPLKGSPLAGTWIIVLQRSVSPKQFLCKSDPHANDVATVVSGSDYHTNFQSDNQISYSFAYPYTRDGKVGDWWKSTADASIPTAGDMNPLNGTGRPPRDTTNPAGGKAANSGNHQGDGQIVAFGDAHAEFVRRPDVGQNNDNIYTTSGAKGGSPRGTPPTQAPIDIESSPGSSDIVLVPVRNLDTGKLW